MKPQIAIAQADGIFAAWQDFNPGIYNGQYFTSRILLTSSDITIKPVVFQYSLTVDMPDRLDTGTNVSVTTSGRTVVFSTPFNGGVDSPTQPHIQITLLDAVAGDQVVLTSVALASFFVQIMNSGVPVARSINWLAQGY